jgi:hypothetical protein
LHFFSLFDKQMFHPTRLLGFAFLDFPYLGLLVYGFLTKYPPYSFNWHLSVSKEFYEKTLLEKKEISFKNVVKNIQAAADTNGARTVVIA